MATAIRKLIELDGEWRGNASDLLDDLDRIMPDAVTRARGWPRDAIRLSGRVRRAAPALRQTGVPVKLGCPLLANIIENNPALAANSQAMSAFRPIASAVPPGADVPGAVADYRR